MKKLITILLFTLLPFHGFAAWPEQEIQRIENYLNAITTMQASFSQFSQGQDAQGTFYLSRPGKLRWQYTPPNPLIIIANGSLLTYYDAELDQISHIPLNENITSFLTRKHISFKEGVKITEFERFDNSIRIAIVQPGKEEQGQLAFVFKADKIELREMEVLDAVGERTHVAFDKIQYNIPLNNTLFTLPRFNKKQR